MHTPSAKYLYGRTSTFGVPLRATKAEEDALMASLDPTASLKARRRPVLMSHEDRQRLITQAFPVVVVHPHSYTWGGVHIREAVPEAGHRVHQLNAEDEEWCKNKWEEK